MKIGIFAGTFDPIHSGHLGFAEQSVARANLDKVVIVAEKEPYRKKPRVPWDHRQAMIERATENISQVDHDYHFAAKLAQQHTLQNVLQSAEAHYGLGHKFWFLVGSDVFEHLHKWHDVVMSNEYGGFLVALRDNHTPGWVVEKGRVMGLKTSQIVLVKNHHPHISSSAIRHAASRGETIESTPASVTDYILAHQLYN